MALDFKPSEYRVVVDGFTYSLSVYDHCADVSASVRTSRNGKWTALNDVDADGESCDWPNLDAAKAACERHYARACEKRGSKAE